MANRPKFPPNLGSLPADLLLEILCHLPNPWLQACRLAFLSERFYQLRVHYERTLFRRVVFDGSSPDDRNLWRRFLEDGPPHFCEMVRVLTISRSDRAVFERRLQTDTEQRFLLRKSLQRFCNLQELDIIAISGHPDRCLLADMNRLMFLRRLSIRFNRPLNPHDVEIWKTICSRLESLAVTVTTGDDFCVALPEYLLPMTGVLRGLEMTDEKDTWRIGYPLIGPYYVDRCIYLQPNGVYVHFRKLLVSTYSVERFRQLTKLVIRHPLCVEANDLMTILGQCMHITHLDVAAAEVVRLHNLRVLEFKLLPAKIFRDFALCRQKFISLNFQQWKTLVDDSIVFDAIKPFAQSLREFYFQPRCVRVRNMFLFAEIDALVPRKNIDVLKQLVENCPRLKVVSIGEAGKDECGCQVFGCVRPNCENAYKCQQEFGNIGTLSSLAELETLCLRNVNMSKPEDLCDIVANCKGLRRLVLTRIFTDSCVRRIPLLPEALGLCTDLTCLSVIDEGMVFDDVLLAALSKLHSIETIMLCTKQVITDTLKVLSKLISKISTSAAFIAVGCVPDSDTGLSELMDCEKELRPNCSLEFLHWHPEGFWQGVLAGLESHVQMPGTHSASFVIQ